MGVTIRVPGLHAAVVAIAFGASAATAQTSSRLAGCWRTAPALGPTYSVTTVPRDSAFRVLVLKDSGHIAFPMLSAREQSMWSARSAWSAHGDSIAVRVFTGLVGWDATLVRDADGSSLRGTAHYLTDVIVRGAEPPRVPVVFSRMACEASWPGVMSNQSPASPWQRGEAVYFATQVDRAAALARDAPLPVGILAARPLDADEHVFNVATHPRRGLVRVVLQFVVESSGRADARNVKVLATPDSNSVRRIVKVLPALRFAPARKDGISVHQLAVWLFEVRE